MPYPHFSRSSALHQILFPDLSGKPQLNKHGSRVMTPALGLRDLGMARSVRGLLTDAVCRVSGPCAFLRKIVMKFMLQKFAAGLH